MKIGKGDLAIVPELESHFESSVNEIQGYGHRTISGNGHEENGYIGNCMQDELLELFLELNFQNAFFKSRFDDLSSVKLNRERSFSELHLASGDSSTDATELVRRIESLESEIRDEKQTRAAAEAAMTHLREVYTEADARAQDLAAKLAEAQEKYDREIKIRDGKYSELDSKFQRLHKRAKQRIQDIQKEKDDLEARFNEINDAAEKTSSQLLSVNQELERTRQQANDALKAMDAERQSLRSANNRLRDNLEELRRSIEPKDRNIDSLQQTLSEKDKMLEDMRGLLQAAEIKSQASISEYSAKHQKIIENLEAQLTDALADRSKSAETISSLQKVIAERDSKIAELEVACSGEAARLGAALECLKGELGLQKERHEKEKEDWETTIASLKAKIEAAESRCIRAEIEAAKVNSQLESDILTKSQILARKDAELASAKEEIRRIETEFSSYKLRAHSLLQKKDAEIAAFKESEQLKDLEEALKEAERELSLASVERDKAIKNLQEKIILHDVQLAERDEDLANAMQRINDVELKLTTTVSRHQSEKSDWEVNMHNLEEMWRSRLAALEADKEASSSQEVNKELDDLKLKNKKLKEESDSLRDLADKMIEEKDKEISRLLGDNKKLRSSLNSINKADRNDFQTTLQNEDPHNPNSSLAEQQILLLARQQAKREEELAQSQRHILVLQEEIAELEKENRLHNQQEAMLKTEIREMERRQKREGVDMTYLKNVILKLLETGEVEALLPVVAMLLQFSPQEVQKCQRAYRASIANAQNSPPSEASASPLSLFPRFSFS